MQAHLKSYKPEIKSVQDTKSCHMWPLEKTCNKTKGNDTMATSWHRRTIKAPVKLDLQYRLHADSVSLPVTKSKVTDKSVSSEQILEQYGTNILPTK